jgi:hypothetical protein
VIVLGFTVIGMTVAPAPPSTQLLAGSSLVTVLVVCALYAWLGRVGGKRPEPLPRWTEWT